VSSRLSSASDSPLVFAWDEPRGRRAALAGFIFGSLLLHALCFYAFQIVYPPAIALLPPPGRVTLISPDTAAGRVLLNWIDAEDPALASTTQPLGQEKLSLPSVQHQPSYLSHQPALKEAPDFDSNPGIPSANPPGPVEALRQPARPTKPNSPTIIWFSPEIETMMPKQIPEVKWRSSGREAPDTAEFRIAVSEKGYIRYCFLEASSGDTALDEQARRYLLLLRLPGEPVSPTQNENQLTWGTAIIGWGNDITAPPKEASGEPAP
jgi:hypothetical protein